MRYHLLLLAMPALAAESASFLMAGLQVTPVAWDKHANLASLERYARQAAAKGAKVIVTPEGFLEGYVGNKGRSPGLTGAEYSAAGEAIDGALLTRISELSRELRVYLMVGFAEKRDGATFNTVATFSPEGAVSTRYSKTHTLDDEPFNTKGGEFPVADTPLGRWGTLICFDRQLPETSRILALKGAQVIFLPSWGSYGEMNDMMVRVRAYENGVYVAFVHPKHTLIVNPKGDVIARGASEDDQIVYGEIRLELQVNQRAPIRFRRPGLYGELAK